jgi:dihydropteroate synthase
VTAQSDRMALSVADKPGTATNSAANPLRRLLSLGRPLVMGILNVTPDSFSDGGRFFDPATAVAHARAMAAQGADILDVGAESTRPYGGAKPVSAEDERDRLSPVLPAVVKTGVPVSIDTVKAVTAAWALDAGAAIVNDVWGLQRDPAMAPLVAARGVPVIIMHNRRASDPPSTSWPT